MVWIYDQYDNSTKNTKIKNIQEGNYVNVLQFDDQKNITKIVQEAVVYVHQIKTQRTRLCNVNDGDHFFTDYHIFYGTEKNNLGVIRNDNNSFSLYPYAIRPRMFSHFGVRELKAGIMLHINKYAAHGTNANGWLEVKKIDCSVSETDNLYNIVLDGPEHHYIVNNHMVSDMSFLFYPFIQLLQSYWNNKSDQIESIINTTKHRSSLVSELFYSIKNNTKILKSYMKNDNYGTNVVEMPRSFQFTQSFHGFFNKPNNYQIWKTLLTKVVQNGFGILFVLNNPLFHDFVFNSWIYVTDQYISNLSKE